MSVKFSDKYSRRKDEEINQLQQIYGKFDSIEKPFVTNSIYYQ